MDISPVQFVSNVEKRTSRKITFQKILYWACLCIALAAVLPAIPAGAQEDRPQIFPGERKPTRKKDAGPRAVGVLQLAANGKASLVPIAILINGKFWDASAYKADPVPMALDSGTVYEVERAGSSLGLFTVNSALHSNAANAPMPWLGTGSWVPAGSEPPKQGVTAEKEPVSIESTDEPPRLARTSGAQSAPRSSQVPSTPATAPPGSTGSAQPNSGQSNPSSSGQKSSAQTSPESGQTKPTQTSPSSSGSSQTGSGSSQTPTTSTPPTSSPTPTPSGTSKPADAKPDDAKTTQAKASEGPPPAPSDSGADESSRPRLRRGKPVGPLPEDEVPGYSKPGAAASTTSATSAKASEPSTPLQLIPAISDAGGPQPKSFGFEWLKGEEGDRLKQMTDFANQAVRSYVEARAKARIVPAPKTAAPHPARSSAARNSTPKLKDPILENVQMKAYDLWNNNQPILIFTADAHMPPPPEGTPHSAYDSDLQYSVTLAANPDIYNNLHKLYVGVTDKYHLDVTPRLELIDAVDADGDGNGELLFREISDIGSGWIIYRPTADKLWKMFDSLNPD